MGAFLFSLLSNNLAVDLLSNNQKKGKYNLLSQLFMRVMLGFEVGANRECLTLSHKSDFTSGVSDDFSDFELQSHTV